MADRKIIYEPHPVTPERKAELRAKGFHIVDAKFAPPDALSAPEPIEAEAVTRTQLVRMRKADLRALAVAEGLNHEGTVDDLRERLAWHLFED